MTSEFVRLSNDNIGLIDALLQSAKRMERVGFLLSGWSRDLAEQKQVSVLLR